MTTDKTKNSIYLDSAALYPTLDCALEAYRAAPFGNPSSEHAAGIAARKAMEDARERIAACIDCRPEKITFVSTATEGAATALMTMARLCSGSVSCSDVEHHAVSENIRQSAYVIDRRSYSNRNHGYASMLAQNETGEVFVDDTGEALAIPPYITREHDILFCDATAAVGHIPVSFRKLGCNYMVADGLKFGGVPGAAILVTGSGTRLVPLIYGGGQENMDRAGTENVPAICAMAAALEWQTKNMEENTKKLTSMRDYLRTELSAIPNVVFNTPTDRPTLPHILNLSFPGLDAHALVLMLSQQDGIYVSAGAACTTGDNAPSHVIMAISNGDVARARGSIRISLSHENALEECVYAAQKIRERVEFLRKIS